MQILDPMTTTMTRSTRAALKAQALAGEDAEAMVPTELPPTTRRARKPLAEVTANDSTSTDVEQIDGIAENENEGKNSTRGKKKGGRKGKQDVAAAAAATTTAEEQAVETAPEQATVEMQDHIETVDARVDTGAVAPTEAPSAQELPLDSEATPDAAPALAPDMAEVLAPETSPAPQEAEIPKLFPIPSVQKRLSILESVDALDDWADEIEKIDAALPSPGITSPVQLRRSLHKAEVAHALDSAMEGPEAPMPLKPSAKNLVIASKAKPTTKKPSMTKVVKSIQQKPEVQASKPAASGISRTQKLDGTKRLSSDHKAPFQPVKSTKPPTRPTFELPGEAVARRLKEQREARQKREEEAQAQGQAGKRDFKARPMSFGGGNGPEVRLTNAVRARLSMASGGPAHAGLTAFSRRASTLSSSSSNNSGNTRPSSTLSSRASMSAAIRPVAASNTSVKRGSLLHSASTSAGVAGRGKQVYARPRLLQSEQDRERKAKEEAARKARADAAERGRAASREWAERQKARKLAEAKAKAATAATGGASTGPV